MHLFHSRPTCFPIASFIIVISLIVLSTKTIAAEDRNGNDSRWRVISESSVSLLETTLLTTHQGKTKWRVSDVKIQKDHAVICGKNADNVSACAWLGHPEQSHPKAVRFAHISIDGPAEFIAALETALNKLPETIWIAVNSESTPYPDAQEGWAQAAWELIDLNRAQTAVALLREMEQANGKNIERDALLTLALSESGNKDEAGSLQKGLDATEYHHPVVEAVKARIAFSASPDPATFDDWMSAMSMLPKGSDAKCQSTIRLFSSALNSAPHMISDIPAMADRLKECRQLPEWVVKNLMKKGMATEALAYIDRVIARDGKSKNENNRILKARVLRRLKRYEEAVSLLREIYKRSPENEGVITEHSTLATSLPDDMEAAYREKMLAIAEKNPDDLQAAHAAAVMSYYHGDFETVIPIMDRLRERLPNNGRVYIYGGMSRFETGDPQGAGQWLDKLEKHHRNSGDLFYCRAVLSSMTNPKKAAEYLARFLAQPIGPDDYLEKHMKAQAIYDRLVKGEKVDMSMSTILKNKSFGGCNSIPSANDLFLLLLSILIVAIRERTRQNRIDESS